MKWRGTYNLILLLALMTSCGSGKQDDMANAAADTVIHHPDVSEINTILPQAGHVALVETHCVPCHSLRYIEMQPKLSYAAWERIVDKMITMYKAPIRDSITRRQIIDYLHAIKGTGQ